MISRYTVYTTQYHRLLGKLIYLLHTHLYIAYPVSLVSQFIHSPSQRHHKAVCYILRYLISTPGKGLLFQKTLQQNIEACTHRIGQAQ